MTQRGTVACSYLHGVEGWRKEERHPESHHVHLDLISTALWVPCVTLDNFKTKGLHFKTNQVDTQVCLTLVEERLGERKALNPSSRGQKSDHFCWTTLWPQAFRKPCSQRGIFFRLSLAVRTLWWWCMVSSWDAMMHYDWTLTLAFLNKEFESPGRGSCTPQHT